MSLTIIKGPPNSGRTDRVKQEFEASLARNPILVVPSTDDIFDWERRLARDSGAYLGGNVKHFKDLINEVLAGSGGDVRDFGDDDRFASGIMRRLLAEDAIAAGWPSLLELLEVQPGLVDAILSLIDEFRSNLIDPDSLEARIRDAGEDPSRSPVLATYRQFVDRLETAGLVDAPALAVQATKASLEHWEGRPLFVVGFDDLTKQQGTLLGRLGQVTDVTLAITHEEASPAVAVTQALLDQLATDYGAEVREKTTRPKVPKDHDALLFQIERRFMKERDPDEPGIAAGEALTLIRSAGRRGEAEAVGAQIATLLDQKVDPGSIGIAVDNPATQGRPFRDVLNEYEVPVTLEAETPATGAVVGQALIALLEAGSPSGSGQQLVAALRGPFGLDQAAVDQVEYQVVRGKIADAAEAEKLFFSIAQAPVPGWKKLRDGDAIDAVNEALDAMTRNLLSGAAGQLPVDSVAAEIQLISAVRRATEELESIHARIEIVDLLKALRSGVIKTWAIPSGNTVRIGSPYSFRAKRLEHLFIVSLQERSPGDEGGGPLLTRASRDGYGLPDMTDPELQEAYLFYSCIAVPTKGLWLSARVSDEKGEAEFPSPLIGEVTSLFEKPEDIPLIERTGADVLFRVDQAPSRNELLRTAAVIRETTGGLRLDGDLNQLVEAPLVGARAVAQSTRELANISGEALIRLRSQRRFSATGIEAFLECPYKWFIERALGTNRFEPDPDAMAKGNLIHAVLEDVYSSSSRAGSLPGEVEPVDVWVDAARRSVEEKAKEVGLGSETGTHRLIRQQSFAEIKRFLNREAGQTSFSFRPSEHEAKFGFPEKELGDSAWANDELFRNPGSWAGKPPLDLGEGFLRGSIDRIDVAPDGLAVVWDYKSGRSSIRAKADMKKELKIQPLLYMLAVEKLWGLNPVAGLYAPVCRGDGRPRGVIDKEWKAEFTEQLNAYGPDANGTSAEEIEWARQEAETAIGKVMSGLIEHDHSQCLEHFQHPAVPDWKYDGEDEEGPPRKNG